MIIIHDSRLPEAAIINLHKYGEYLPFITENITQNAIAGHPDIFFCPVDEKMIVAPNIPAVYIDFLLEKKVDYVTGKTIVGNQKQNTTPYNAVITDKYVIHNSRFTDVSILEATKNKIFIDVKQGFTRCSLMPLKDDNFLVSDKGIEKKLQEYELNCHFFSPEEIILPGLTYGLIGGCMGAYQNKVFIIGRLKYHSDGDKTKLLLRNLNYEIVELYDGKLFDGGSLFFIQSDQEFFDISAQTGGFSRTQPGI